MDSCWMLVVSVMFGCFVWFINYLVGRKYTPRLDRSHISSVVDDIRKQTGVKSVEPPIESIKCDESININVLDDGKYWTGEAERISKRLDPSGNLRIHVHIVRHFSTPTSESPYIDSFHGLPRHKLFVFSCSSALVVGQSLIFLPLPMEQSGLLVGLIGATALYLAEGGTGLPVIYTFNTDPSLTERIKSMILRKAGFLSIACGALLQFIAMQRPA